MSDQHVSDENLRLILSKQEKEWIEAELRSAVKFILGFSIALCLCISWLNFSTSLLDEPQKNCIYFQDKMDVDEEIGVSVNDICTESTKSEEAGVWASSLIRFTSICVVILVIGLPFGIGRNLFLYFKFRRYLKEHESFLDKYNRV